ncbi:MAG: tail tape measure protein [Caenibius sp.]
MTEDPIDTMLVEVRASTRGFASDIEAMRGTVDSSLTDGFSRAGSVLERGLATAIRKGNLGFDDLKRVALRSMDEIASQAVRAGIGSLGIGGGANGGVAGSIGNMLSGAVGSLLGLPGRATGGPVSPYRPYLVGERGPELFVPTSAGRVENGTSNGGGPARDVRVAISLNAPRGSSTPQSLQRSARQVASTVRRALTTR